MDQETQRRMLERAAQLIDGAGGGDWNREEADWQLAAAEWKKDLESLHARPDPFVLEDNLTPREAVQRAVGAASMCWEHPGGAGVFDTDRAAHIARTLVSWLRRHPADDSKDLVARAWSLLRQVPEGMVLPPWEQQAHQLGADIRAHGWFPRSADPDQQPLALEADQPSQRWPAEYTSTDGPVSADRLVAFVSDSADTAVDAEVVDPDLENTGPKRPMLPAAYPAGRLGGRSTGPRIEVSQDRIAAYDSTGAQTLNVPLTDAGGYPTAPGVPDLGDDPDGDLDGYDGPMGTPGGYCTYRPENAEPHLPGTWLDCPLCGFCQHNGATPHPRGSRPGCSGCGQTRPEAPGSLFVPADVVAEALPPERGAR